MGLQSFTAVWSAAALVAVLLLGFAGLLWASVAFETWLDGSNRPGKKQRADLLGEPPSAPTSRAA
jgi:hypothetical protein